MKYINLSHPSKRLLLCLCIEFILISSLILLTGIFLNHEANKIDLLSLNKVLTATFVSLNCLVCMYYANLYNFRTYRQKYQLVKKISQSIILATIVLSACFYILPFLSINSMFLIFNMILIWSVLITWRLWLQRTFVHLKRRVRVIIIGTDDQAKRIAYEILENQMLGYDFRGFIGEHNTIAGECPGA